MEGSSSFSRAIDMVHELPIGVGSESKLFGDSQVIFFCLINILHPVSG